jgi:hypothetical protein
LPRPDRWKSRLFTATAMAALCWAWFVVAVFPFSWWRGTLGGRAGEPGDEGMTAEGRRLAAHVEWAARLLPVPLKCLPRAMALSWFLQSRKIGHSVVFAVRPPELRGSNDQLHAWVEMSGETILGDLPGPWFETLRLGP